jgi:hypothetical protein
MRPVPFLQLLLTTAACFGLWRLCRRQPAIVIAGFLIRAFVAQALFWISYLQLPVARSLQLGNGLWFFAIDGQHYLKDATKLVARGLAAILFLGDEFPSRFFVQVLSLFAGAFGGVASAAILLNCAAYLLTCAIVLRLCRNDVVLAAMAFSPASILFALQPLKDTLFMMLIVAVFAAFRRWEELWRAGGTRTQFLACAAAMLALVYGLAGIRWYFAAIVCGASAIFCVLAALRARRRGWAFAANALLVVLLAQSVRLGALDLPPSYDRLLNPMTAVQWRPAAAKEHIAAVRYGFETTPGATTIATGTALAPPPATSPPPPPTQTTAPPPKPAAAPAPTSNPAPAPVPAPQPPPQTVASRVTTGFAAMFLPRILAESLGIIRVGGGRGLWLFAELDTIMFDCVLLYAIVHCTRSLRRGRARLTATFVLCIVVLVMTAGPMLYTVNNFGTLFRLRLMVYYLAAILPITLRYQPSIERTDAVQ